MTQATRQKQRRSERNPAQIVVTLVLEGDDAKYLADGVDLSLHGMRVRTDVPLEPGQRVGLVLSDTPTYAIAARVVWLGTAESKQAGEAGVEFMKPLEAPM